MSVSRTQPRSADVIAGDAPAATQPLEWDDVLERFGGVMTYWLTSVARDGRPSVRPVFGVIVDGRFHTTSNVEARKARNLARDGRCTVSAGADGVDVVLDGTAERVLDPDHLERVAAAYRDKYDWAVTVDGDALDAPYGAPTAGPPPYAPFAVTPVAAWGFGTSDDTHTRTTRFHF